MNRPRTNRSSQSSALQTPTPQGTRPMRRKFLRSQTPATLLRRTKLLRMRKQWTKAPTRRPRPRPPATLSPPPRPIPPTVRRPIPTRAMCPAIPRIPRLPTIRRMRKSPKTTRSSPRATRASPPAAACALLQKAAPRSWPYWTRARSTWRKSTKPTAARRSASPMRSWPTPPGRTQPTSLP